MKTQKIKLVIFLSIVILSISCKKEDITNSNIVYKKLNTQIEVGTSLVFDTIVALDLDDNTTIDFNLQISYTSIGRLSEYGLYITVDDSRNQWLIYQDGEENIARNLIIDEVIEGASTIWDDYILFYRKYINNGVTLINFTGTVGVGDVFAGIRFIADDGEYRYGWIKMAISSDFKTIQIKEYAYQKQPNIAIKAGEK